MTEPDAVLNWTIGDAWTRRVDDVLSQYRHEASGLSWGGPEDRIWDESVLSLDALKWALGRALSLLSDGPGRWVLTISEEEDEGWLWRAVAYEDGSLLTEVVGNELLDAMNRIPPVGLRQLASLGWEPPFPPLIPTWRRIEPTTNPEAWIAGKQALAALRTVFLLGDETRLRLATSSWADRGPTPGAGNLPVTEFTRDLRGLESCLSWKISDFDDYCRQLCSKDEERSRTYNEWRSRTAQHNSSMGLWKVRERGRAAWEAEQGADPSHWPLLHPPAVLWSPNFATAACLHCTWVNRRSVQEVDLRVAGRRARRHSVEYGGDVEVVRQLRIRITERNGPHDEPLEVRWV